MVEDKTLEDVLYTLIKEVSEAVAQYHDADIPYHIMGAAIKAATPWGFVHEGWLTARIREASAQIQQEEIQELDRREEL